MPNIEEEWKNINIFYTHYFKGLELEGELAHFVENYKKDKKISRFA